MTPQPTRGERTPVPKDPVVGRNLAPATDEEAHTLAKLAAEATKPNPLAGLAIGRIVLYVCPDQYVGRGGVYNTVGIRPAIVTRVITTTDERPTGLVNLHVIFDIDDPSIHTMREWRPSVDYDEAKRPGSWHWPPRV